MKESYSKGIANHTGPESCLDDPRGSGEALTGGSAGGLLSSENTLFREPSQSFVSEGTRRVRVTTRADYHPAESRNLACADTFLTGIGRPRKGGQL